MNRYQTKPRGLSKRPTKRSRTGIPGVGFSMSVRHGKLVSYFTANVGHLRKFNINQLGRDGALRQALKARAQYERSRS
jgi:hypothetical protein